MGFHIVLSRGVDAAAIRAADAGERPSHAMIGLAAALDAEMVYPRGERPTLLDRARARLIGGPVHWTVARALCRRLTRDDVVFCADEISGLPVALTALRRGGPRVVVYIHNAGRPRVRTLIRLLRLARSRASFMTVSERQSDILRDTLGIDPARVLTIWDQTDTSWFRPADAPPRNARPLLMSVGLEQRDYRTLAAATGSLDVDVRISGFSPDARAYERTFPATLPANMARAFYDWPDLRALYQRADIAVVSLFPNDYAAGIQVLLEAIACGTPVVVTRSAGLAGMLREIEGLRVVPMGDVAAMRAAIAAMLADPAAARRHAATLRERYRAAIDSTRYVREIADHLRSA